MLGERSFSELKYQVCPSVLPVGNSVLFAFIVSSYMWWISPEERLSRNTGDCLLPFPTLFLANECIFGGS